MNIKLKNCDDSHIGPTVVHHEPINIVLQQNKRNNKKSSILFTVTITNILIVLVLAGIVLVKYNIFCFPSYFNRTRTHIISRVEWDAELPQKKLKSIKLPSDTVIIALTLAPNLSTKEMCICQIRQIQSHHMYTRHFHDIGYNFLVCGDGNVYVGRGWNNQSEHALGLPPKSISVSFVGSFLDTEPPQSQLLAVQNLIEEGVLLQKLSFNYRLYGQRQLAIAGTPGEALFKAIKTWDHWTEEN